jgi:hypothetical protein
MSEVVFAFSRLLAPRRKYEQVGASVAVQSKFPCSDDPDLPGCYVVTVQSDGSVLYTPVEFLKKGTES